MRKTKLQKMREDMGLTQFDMVHALNVSINAYRQWEYGVAHPNLENQQKLDEFFKTHVKVGELAE